MNIHDAIVPLPIESIKEYFNDKTIIFSIDYENSKLKTNVFLTYLSNLNIPSNITISDDYPIEDVYNLIDAYMNIKSISNIGLLEDMVSHIILQAAGVEFPGDRPSYLTKEQADYYITTRKETIDKWLHFLDSLIVYLIYAVKDLKDTLGVDSYPVIDDPDYLGYNIVKLLTLPSFYEVFLLVDRHEVPMSFFKAQFTGYMYKGDNLYSFFATDANMIIPMLILQLDNKDNNG